jgi:hypothetical protein
MSYGLVAMARLMGLMGLTHDGIWIAIALGALSA